MSVPHPGGEPNAQLYEQLKRDVLERVPHVTSIEYVPDSVEARALNATIDPVRLNPPTGPNAPTLSIEWYRGSPDDWFRIDYSDPNTGFHAGWHQDEDHPELGTAHFQYTTAETADRRGIAFEHETPSLILWEIIETLLIEILPTLWIPPTDT